MHSHSPLPPPPNNNNNNFFCSKRAEKSHFVNDFRQSKLTASHGIINVQVLHHIWGFDSNTQHTNKNIYHTLNQTCIIYM